MTGTIYPGSNLHSDFAVVAGFMLILQMTVGEAKYCAAAYQGLERATAIPRTSLGYWPLTAQ
jgi:hypothetical protein